MVNFIKTSSLIIILLFFPISFYFNIMPIYCNSENNLHVRMEIIIFFDRNYKKWYAQITNFFLKNNSESLVIEDIDWGELNRNGNIFYVNILIKKFRNREKNEVVFCSSYDYDLGILEEGNYTFKAYVNGKLCETENFIVGKPEEEIPTLRYGLFPYIEWNGEEWIARVRLSANMVPKGIHWGNVIKTKDGFMINIIVEEWTGNISKYSYRYGEHNYSLGILEEGEYWFDMYVNDELDGIHSFIVSRIFTTYIPSTYTTTETRTVPDIIYSDGKYFEVTTTITETRIESSKLITTTIKIKEKTTTVMTKSLSTKTIETSKEKFEIENFIPIFSFIIVIMITILLYYFLFKRREI